MKNKSFFLYYIVRSLVWIFYPKIRVCGKENIPDEPVIFVGNHTQMNGPIMAQLYFPGRRYIWCAAEMMEWKEVHTYAFTDFWSFKPKWTHWFYRLLSYLITPLSVIIFNNADTIPVYRDGRLRDTFRMSADALAEGASLVIFPEKNAHYNHILYDFQEGFVDAARLYHRKTGREPFFVPVYLAPSLKKIVFGKPVRFDSSAPSKAERARISSCMKEEITRMAESLPRHRVVPYRNIPKKDYPWSRPE
ncbi:MAG: 1-acyl-sn-glycerol-3-phosphate acyltransferase [Lachnospiraceae bacterium]|nr:1-acyl-sn-glycerol-3-phosphate acyltransferase [Lachnospiraceae bacterium]